MAPGVSPGRRPGGSGAGAEAGYDASLGGLGWGEPWGQAPADWLPGLRGGGGSAVPGTGVLGQARLGAGESGLLPPLHVTLARTEGQLFRERVGFLILCVIGAYCAMRILVELKSILEPFLWALFLVMAWKPVVDGVERRTERLLATACPWLRADTVLSRSCAGSTPGAGGDADDLSGELQRMIEDNDLEPNVIGARNEVTPEDALTMRAGRAVASERPQPSCQDVDDEEEGFLDGGRGGLRRAMARGLAVLVATCGMLGLLSGFGFLILESARHMRDHWDVYQKGAVLLTKEMKVLFQKVPDSVKRQYQDVSADMVKTAQDFLYGLLGDFVNNVSSLLLGGLLTLLYTLFWLCSPVPMDSSIDVMFRKYILFKTLACFGYGVCVGLLLAFLSIDLASVFALTTFALNYVPEVGPFVAMILPCPIILLDSRLDRPFLVLMTAVLGQLALKFAFSNIIEVKLIESDKKLRMHPVMILLSVGIFGYLWGPTGMLLSVPLMALLKISLFSELVPSSYRNPILVVLEGDRDAPLKHGLGISGAERRKGPRRAPPGG